MKKLIILCAVIICVCSFSACSEDEEIIISGDEQSTEEEMDPSTEASTEGYADHGVYVYVTGAVKYPGVYEVPLDTRVFQVIDKAGGFSEGAEIKSLNLASLVQDGSVIRVPDISQRADIESGVEAFGEAAPGNSLININTASLTDLTHINGIGESRARAIIAYREENGSFSCIEDIKKVSGIKDGLFNKIKDQITV